MTPFCLPPYRALLVSTLCLTLGCSDGSSAAEEESASSAAGAAGAAGAASAPAPSGGDAGNSLGAGGAGAPSSSVTLPPRIERYLRASSPRLVIELDSVAALAPYPESTEYIGPWLSSIVDKPEGVELEPDETLEPVGSSFEWTFEALDNFARAHARDDADGPVRIHVLSVDGRYVTENSSGTVLGLAWGNRFVALFQDAIRSRCQSGIAGALQQDICEIAERNVWAHELGHTLGLVDNGLPMVTNHRDPEHGKHDIREGCLMYWAYDGPEVFDTLLARFGSAEQDLELCAESEADLQAAR